MSNNNRFPLPPRIVLWGGSGIAVMLRETIEYYGSKIEAIISDKIDSKNNFPDIPRCHGIEGFREWLQGKDPTNLGYFNTISGRNGRIKLQKNQLLEAEGLRPVTIVHQTSFIARDAEIGAGTLIDALCVVMARVRVGNHCNIGPNTNLSHDDILGDAVDTSVGSTICGNVHVGTNVCIGAGVTVLPWLTIGDDAMIGAGSVVTKSVPAGVTVIGSPAREYVKK